MLLGTLRASLLGNVLAGKEVIKAGEEAARAGYGSKRSSIKNNGLLLEEVSETNKNEAKEQKGGFLCMLLGTLEVSLLGNVLAGKEVSKAGEEAARAGYGSNIIKSCCM